MGRNGSIKIGPELRAARVKAGLSRAELAEKLGTDRTRVRYWEQNLSGVREHRLPSIADALGTTVDALQAAGGASDSEDYARDQLTEIGERVDEIYNSMRTAWVLELTTALRETEALIAAPDVPQIDEVLRRRLSSLTRRVAALEKRSA